MAHHIVTHGFLEPDGVAHIVTRGFSSAEPAPDFTPPCPYRPRRADEGAGRFRAVDAAADARKRVPDAGATRRRAVDGCE